MSTDFPKLGFLAYLRFRWHLLLRSILHWWVKAKILPSPFEDLAINLDNPICYVIDSYALSTLLIMDKTCEELGLPRPLWPLQQKSRAESRAYLALRRKKGLIIRHTTPRSHSETLRKMVERVSSGEEPDIQLVPVSVFIGRAPDKETGLAKIFFTESWEIGGRINRLINSLINGRSTMVQYSLPISLRPDAAEDLLFHDVADGFHAIAVHRERSVLCPPGAIELAYTQPCSLAFRVAGKRFWACQFHPEVDLATLVARLTIYKDAYTDGDDHLEEVLSNAVETPDANNLMWKFVDRVVR